eukprot:390366_1
METLLRLTRIIHALTPDELNSTINFFGEDLKAIITSVDNEYQNIDKIVFNHFKTKLNTAQSSLFNHIIKQIQTINEKVMQIVSLRETNLNQNEYKINNEIDANNINKLPSDILVEISL